MIRLTNLTPLVVGAEEAFDAGREDGAGKDFGNGMEKGSDKDFVGVDFVAVAEGDVSRGFGADDGRGVDEIVGSRSFHAPKVGVEGASRCSLSSSLTRRGLAAPDIGWECESGRSLSASLTRRGLAAPDAGGAAVEAGATSGGSCSATGMNEDMTSQSCRKTIIL
jgi:hypothetical protein